MISNALFFIGDLISGLLPVSFADWLEGKREAREHDARNWSPPR
jgi:hypothetical protein